MTLDQNSRIQLPRWVVEIIVLIAVGLSGYMGGIFVESVQFKQNIADRVTTLEKQDNGIITKQDENTAARLRMEVELNDIEKKLDENHELLLEHMQRERRP